MQPGMCIIDNIPDQPHHFLPSQPPFSKESTEVAVQRVSEMLDKEAKFWFQSGNRTYTDLVFDTFAKMDINSNHDLNIALNETRDSPQLARAFVERFKDVSGGLKLLHKE